ncbi:AMP-binding protein [Phenylobacterium sp.]|uniref:AMP-binding protein n=1 Tax=Phenylobacterium sp. TaxID=1871053 RepID=UPI00122721B1|nr:AMP-binding protein [Phenylobacterium sp.]THD61872.1 MAG: hypothetical protein E8A49_09150 [Phenylobacterium sp.]
MRENLPLSPNEERYVLAETMTGQIYMAPSAVRILGKVDLSGFEGLLQATCDRHEARRTGFEASGDGGFRKYVEDRGRVSMKRLSMPGASDEALRAAVREHVYQKSDFSPGTLHRFLMIEVGPEDHVVAMGLHHATSDGVTTSAFQMELFMRLFGFPLPAESEVTQYSDVWDFDWRNSDAYREAEAFWRERMAGLETAGVWPADRANAPTPEARPGVVREVPPEVAAATQKAAEAIGASHFTFFYAVYMVLLSRLTGAARVCTTFQSAGRRGKAGAEQTHGVFSNALILGTEVDESQSIRTLAGRMRGEIREAIAHEIYPYHHVIRATGVHPRFAINWYPPSPSGAVEGVSFAGIDLIENQDDDDLNLRFHIYEGRMSLALFYDPAAFGAARVEAVAEQVVALADALARDVDAPIAASPLAAFAAPGVLPDPDALLPDDPGRLIHADFLARARETPDAIAIEHGERRFTYAEVEACSRAVAEGLASRGVAAGERVAILAERSPELVFALLGVARLGGVFILLDSAYPEPRLSQLCEIAAPHAVVATGPGLTPLAERLVLAARAKALEVGALRQAARDAAITGLALDRARPDEAAYILFTSGSTGRPKGVACAHGPLSHFLRWQAQSFGLTAADRITLLSGLSHDPLLRDVFAPLSAGGTLLIPQAATVLQPGALAGWLGETRATVVHLTPALGQILAAEAHRAPPLPHLRLMFWGGDFLRPALLAELAPLAPTAEHVNVYGATETPQAAGFFRFDGDLQWSAVPVGAGSNGFQLLVVDAERRPVGVGEAGEIAVRSNRLSLGYVEAGRIVTPSDRGRDATARANIHYTGDRGVRLPDGQVLLTGRQDDQVKIRGHRVELAEVTAALAARPQVRAAAALAVGEAAHRQIAGFVAGPRLSAFDEAATCEALAARLPAYMVPQRIYWLEALPLTPNGKVDRAALAAHVAAQEAAQADQAGPARAPTAREQALIDRWREVLGAARPILPASTFAGLGGDSLSYVQAYLATEEAIGDVPAGWQMMTVAELAAAGRAAAASRWAGWSAVDAPILLRAASIFLVVAGHLGLLRYGGGATTSLLAISGYLFGALQLPQVFAARSVAPATRWLGKLFVPTMLFSVLLFSAKALAGRRPSVSTLLLAADLQDYSKLSPPYWGGHEFYLWFIDCLLQILVLVCLALAVTTRATDFRVSPMRFAAGLFGLACVTRFLLPAAVYPGFFTGQAPAFATVAFLPTTHLPTFMLGVMIALAATRRQKTWVAVTLLGYALMTAGAFNPQQALIALISGAALLTAGQAALPRPVAVTVMAVSGASLFIYLTHFAARDVLRWVHAPAWPALQVAVALAAGIVLSQLWTRGAALLGRAARQPPAAAEPQAAI